MADERSIAHGELWRAFPWDREAPEGGPFSVRSVAPPHMQNYGRFDLHGRPSVLYLAQTPAHALAEVLRGREAVFCPNVGAPKVSWGNL